MFMIHMKLWWSGYKIRKGLRCEFVHVDSSLLRFQEKFAPIGNLFKVL